MIKVNFHSFVDLITNSSTTIYTYQNSIEQTKELVQEVLNICGVKDKTPDDIFNYGTFYEAWYYADIIEDDENMPEDWKESQEYVENIIGKVMAGEMEKPEWLDAEADLENGQSIYLYLHCKDEKYKHLADKIKNLLNSVDAEEGHD